MNLKCPLILGSKSPRRKELLSRLELEFSVQTIDTDESFPIGMDWREVAKFIAEKKGEAFTKSHIDPKVFTNRQFSSIEWIE